MIKKIIAYIIVLPIVIIELPIILIGELLIKIGGLLTRLSILGKFRRKIGRWAGLLKPLNKRRFTNGEESK